MQKNNLLLLSAATMLFMTSCSKLGPLSADNFTVIPNPLEANAGDVPATINGTFPEKYMTPIIIKRQLRLISAVFLLL